jgi:hypothetical protein
MNTEKFTRRKSPQELEDALREQIGFLRTSSRLYDEGNQSEAARLATAVYMICHDGGQNYVSALRHVGVKEKVLFPDTTSLKKTQNINFR